jgi:hypothetical protein
MRALLRTSVGIAAILAAIGCGGSSAVTTTGTPTQTGFAVVITGLRYFPLNFSVPPGATIVVLNNDGMLHSLTSEASVGAYTPGSVNGIAFDTGVFASGTRAILIPANAATGTVIPFYCTVYLGTMATPNGTITIDPNATPTPTPTGVPSGF